MVEIQDFFVRKNFFKPGFRADNVLKKRKDFADSLRRMKNKLLIRNEDCRIIQKIMAD